MKNSNSFHELLNNNKMIKTLFTTLFTLFLACTIHAQDTLKLSDIEVLNHTNWEGQLTYKDYQSGNQTSIDATMQIEIKGDKIITKVQYVYEPNKNHTNSVKLKKNGTYFGNEKIISNSLNNGIRIFVTMYRGKDNGEKANMYTTHQFSENSYKITKEVQIDNSNDRFVRNTYKFTKI